MKTKFLMLVSATLLIGGCSNSHKTGVNTDDSEAIQTPAEPLDTGSIKRSAPVATKAINDTDFLLKVYNTSVFEIEASKLAKRMSERKKVKEFANMMISDHTALDNYAGALLKEKGCTVPTTLPADLQAKMKDLKEYMGQDFEQRYAQDNIEGHKDVIAAFTDASKYSKDITVKKLAASSLPALEKHEQEADSLLVFLNTPAKW